MKEKIEVLIRLQAVETEADLLQTGLNDISGRICLCEEKLVAEEKSAAEESESLEALKKQYRSYESEVRTNQDAIEKNQAHLNTVKTNREYQSLLRGTDDLKKKNSSIEDAMLSMLDQISAAESSLSARKEELETLRKETEKEKERIQKEIEEGNAKLAALDVRRKAVTQEVPPDLLGKFMTIKKRFGSPAIVPIQGIVCQGCNMNIPPQMRNELLRFESLKCCPFCNRIIYWVKAE
ncbi:MAG: zinc ribbon domain-containing protein [Desulfococcaceae bacterium]